MKKIFVFALLLLLASCGTHKQTIASEQPICRQDLNCTHYGIHEHVFFNW